MIQTEFIFNDRGSRRRSPITRCPYCKAIYDWEESPEWCPVCGQDNPRWEYEG